MFKKLNLGSGNDKREGYINIDSNRQFNPDLVMDVRVLDFQPNEVDEILARDILEHIPIAECELTLKHWFAILKPGGKIIIQTPNLQTIAENINALSISNKIDLINVMIKRIFGGQDYDGNFHQNGFTPFTLQCLLNKIGFREITVYPVKDLKTPDYDTNMTIEAVK